MMIWICVAIAWVALGVFNVRQYVLDHLDDFGKVSRRDLAFFIILGGFGAPFAWPIPIAILVKRHTNIRINWDANVWTRK